MVTAAGRLKQDGQEISARYYSYTKSRKKTDTLAGGPNRAVSEETDGTERKTQDQRTAGDDIARSRQGYRGDLGAPIPYEVDWDSFDTYESALPDLLDILD